MASAIVTAQTEIHMIVPHEWFTAQRAYVDLVPLAAINVETKEAINDLLTGPAHRCRIRQTTPCPRLQRQLHRPLRHQSWLMRNCASGQNGPSSRWPI
jgi:hypothetical protein